MKQEDEVTHRHTPTLDKDTNTTQESPTKKSKSKQIPKTDMFVYTMYHDEGYRKFPVLTLSVGGHDVTFLVDSGATTSLSTTLALPFVPKLSGRNCLAMGSSGQACRDHYSVHIWCEMDYQVTKHSFVVSKNCPINLLGRDLMCSLGIILHSTPDGVEVL